MSFLIDIDEDIQIPEYRLELAKLNEEPLVSLKNVNNIHFKPLFVGINNLSFTVPMNIMNSKGVNERNKIYDMVEGDHLVKVNDMEFYLIVNVRELCNEDGSEYKEVECKSREYGLIDKKLTDYKADSRMLYDSSDSMLDGLEQGILNYIFKHITKAWTLGYIDPDLILREGKGIYRALDFPDSNLIQVFADLQKTFNCIFKFDTLKKKVDVYSVDSLKGQDKGLYISDKNFIKSIMKETQSDGIVTRLYLRGKDNISIQSISETGQAYLDNFDYYKNTKYMTQGLIDALDLYNEKIKNYNPDFNPLFEDLKEANSIMEDLLNKDGIDLEDKGLVALQRKASEIQTLIDVKVEELAILQNTINRAEGSDLSELYKTKKSTEVARDALLLQKTEVNSFLGGKEVEIDVQQEEIDRIELEIKSLQNELGADNPNNFTKDQLIELDSFIKVDTFSDSNFTEHNIDELKEEGERQLSRVSQPRIQFEVDVVDFLSLVECQTVWKKFVLGDIVTLVHEGLGINFRVRLVGYEHSADENNLTLLFSNTYSYDDDTLYERDLMEKLDGVSSTVDFNSDKWNDVGSIESRIAKVVDAKLEQSRQQILEAVGQKHLFGDDGLWLYKENPDGTIAPEQIRGINNQIALTDDDWASVKTAISAKDGINAELVRGKLGQFARVEADQVNVGGGDNPPNIIEYIDIEITDTVNNLGDVINNALSDGKLTNIEANSINLALDSVTAESTNLILSATSLGVTTEKTDYSTALATLTNHLNTNWLGGEYPLEITSVQRTAINDYFKDLENKKSILLAKITEVRAIKEIEDKAVEKGKLYNGVKIDAESGLVATRNDDTAKTTVNATEGIKIEGKVNGVWQDNFYVDTNGFIRAKNIIIDGLDSGNKTFNTTPTPPYIVNDLWKVSGIAGVDFKICTTARATGSYVASDWTNVTDSKNYADTIKNLTTGTSLSGGITTIDRNRVRVEHPGGQYSEIRSDGFVRKWKYGEAKYLNDIYIDTYAFSSARYSSKPSLTEVNLPTSFRGRSVEVFLSISNLVLFNGSIASGYLVDLTERVYTTLKVDGVYTNVAKPVIYVDNYIEQYGTYERYGGWENDIDYRRLGFVIQVIGK